MKNYDVKLNEREIDVIIQMFALGQLEIIRQMNIPFKLSKQTDHGCALEPLKLGVRSA